MTQDGATRWDPAEAEPRIVERWLASGLFHPDPEGTRDERFTIALPQPNVTGALHLGHALNASIQDVLVRHMRARGWRTKWTFGTDHAGIATQKVVERQLIAEGTSREALGREAFEARVWQWRDEYGSQIVKQFQRLGASCDYDEEHFTLEARYNRAVLAVFVGLYEKGWVYRDHYMVNWDPGSRSAISDLEVEDREVTDTLYHVAYPLASGDGAITVATVRPVTIPGDVAVAVHPDDERYAHLVGQTAILPLVGRELPIIADECVRPDFGTGALKIAPGHAPTDFEVGRRHGLPELTVIGEDGCMTATAGERFAGLTIAEAEAAIVAELHEQGHVVHSEPYRHVVPFSHRSGARIEPLISLQWFVNMDELAKPAIATVTSGRTKIHPERWRRIYLEWMAKIPPWCISRQLWWGHQLPVWYRGDETYVGLTEPEGEGWERDPDVLDTWFSGVLWPYASLGWPEQTPELRGFYPTDVLVTGHDIIFLWVARMVMLGLEFTGAVPFSDVHVHSVVQAPDGRRMSKSLGTGIDPLDEIATYGADGLRFGLLAMATTQEVRYSTVKIEQGQRLANKLWNASRLILTGVDPDARAAARPRTVEDRWILSRLAAARARIEAQIEGYEFPQAVRSLYDYVFGDLCDWYLELVKPRLAERDADLDATLLHVLSETIALAHPVIPFVTEEIFSRVPGAEGLLAARQVTPPDPDAHDAEAERQVGRAIEAIRAVRGWRTTTGAPAYAPIPARLGADGYEETLPHVVRLARLDVADANGAEAVASIPIPGGAVHVLSDELVDPAVAERRVAARRVVLERQIGKQAKIVENPAFVANAPADVVAAERARLVRLREQLAAV